MGRFEQLCRGANKASLYSEAGTKNSRTDLEAKIREDGHEKHLDPFHTQLDMGYLLWKTNRSLKELLSMGRDLDFEQRAAGGMSIPLHELPKENAPSLNTKFCIGGSQSRRSK